MWIGCAGDDKVGNRLRLDRDESPELLFGDLAGGSEASGQFVGLPSTST